MKKAMVFLSVLAFIVVLAGCAGQGPTPPPNQTQKPQLITVNDGLKNLQNGDPVKGGTTVTFTGSGPADAIIRVYLNGALLGSTTTSPAGSFTWSWTSGTTEGTFTFAFTAEAGGLPESAQETFSLVVDTTQPYLSSCSAKADAPFGAAPTITVRFNEPVVIEDVNVFEHIGFWAVSCAAPILCPGGSHFTVTEVNLEEDSQTVTLTGRWDTDWLVAGDQLVVGFAYSSLMDIKDRAGNAFNAIVSIPTFTVTP